jgi:hypothetical protein
MPQEQPTLSPELFEPAVADTEELEAIHRPSLTFWQDAWRKSAKTVSPPHRCSSSPVGPCLP